MRAFVLDCCVVCSCSWGCGFNPGPLGCASLRPTFVLACQLRGANRITKRALATRLLFLLPSESCWQGWPSNWQQYVQAFHRSCKPLGLNQRQPCSSLSLSPSAQSLVAAAALNPSAPAIASRKSDPKCKRATHLYFGVI